MFESYKIKDVQTFDINRYPEVKNEIALIAKKINNLGSNHKHEIVISFLKDHCIKNEWIKSNQALATMVASGLIESKQTEALFAACKHNQTFLAGFEQYISSELA